MQTALGTPDANRLLLGPRPPGAPCHGPRGLGRPGRGPLPGAPRPLQATRFAPPPTAHTVPELAHHTSHITLGSDESLIITAKRAALFKPGNKEARLHFLLRHFAFGDILSSALKPAQDLETLDGTNPLPLVHTSGTGVP